MGTVGKALELLDLFTRTKPQIGLSDLARLSGVNKATCFRLMTELQEYGLVEQVLPSKEYRIGPAVLRLSAIREESVPMRALVQPLIAELADKTGESVHVSLLVGDRVELVDYAYSTRHGTRVMMNDADHLPFHATSSGIVILAFGPDALRENVLSRDLPRILESTPTDPDDLRARIAQAQAQGFAESRGTFEADVHSIAAPLFGPHGECLGAVAVAAPTNRMEEALRRTILTEITRIAADITARSGGVPPAGLPKP